jgi:hypothetical protein
VRFSLPLKTEGAMLTDGPASNAASSMCGSPVLTPGILYYTWHVRPALRVLAMKKWLSTGPEVLWYLDNTRRACCSISFDGTAERVRMMLSAQCVLLRRYREGNNSCWREPAVHIHPSC